MAVNHYNKKKYVDRTAGAECFPGRIYHAMELSDGGHNTDYAAAPCHVYIYAEVFCGRNCNYRNKGIVRSKKIMKTILVLMDTLNRRYLKTYDEKAKGITPNMDLFARDCAVYENHFIGSAPCMPARRDIFTGRMQFLERGWGGVEPFDITLPSLLREKEFLPTSLPIIPIILKSAERITAICLTHGIITEDRNLIPGYPG